MEIWRIDRDCLEPAGSEDSAVGFGQGSTLELKPYHKRKRFRLLDDDGEIYYAGWSTSESFAPLDWAAHYAGCTEIQYRNRNGEWEAL